MSYVIQIIEQACLIFPLVLGIYLSFSVLRIADLSVDGTFVLGAAVFGKSVSSGVSLPLAFLLALGAGMVAGSITALIQRNNRIDPLIAGILMAFILNSLSLVIMQRPNIGLLGLTSVSMRGMILALIIPILAFGLSIFLMSKTGLWLKAFGNNQQLVAMLGQNPERLRMVGLSISNGLAALSGSLSALASGYADINMGFGQALIGIAMILIGRQLLNIFKRHDLVQDIAAISFTFLGVILYFVLTNEVIRYGLSPVYLKMAIGAFLILFLLLASDRAVHTQSRTT
jgi:putative ABC transport system permease protein